jgi:hypothetical protein
VVSSDHVESFQEGRIQATVRTDGKEGPITKTIQVKTNDPLRPLIVLKLKAEVKDPFHEGISKPGNLFHEPCRRCHVDRGIGKRGGHLFSADCLMCHSRGKDAKPLASLRKLPRDRIKKGIEDGVSDTMMPGFSSRSGGPLTNVQIRSLIEYIKRK